MFGDAANAAIDLMVPVGKTRLKGQILGQIDVITAQAAGIDLLQTHYIKITQQARHPIQVGQALTVGQDMLPTMQQVLVGLPGRDPHLDVVTHDL